MSIIKYFIKKRHDKISNKINIELFNEKKEEIRKIQYRMLSDFDLFCKENDLLYWLEGGSLIGAFFHKGIIPWDDDLDIAMPRESWNKLIKLNPKWKDMVLQKYGNDKGFNSIKFYKLRDKATFINDGRYWSTDSNEYKGLFIDIFVYDDTVFSEYENSNILHKIKVNFVIYSRTFYEIFKFLPYENFLKKIMTKSQSINKNFNYMRLSLRSTTRDNKHYFIEKDLVYPIQYVVFGPGKFPVPNNIEKYLTKQYKKIVKYPPIEKQVPTHLIEYKKVNNDGF